MAGRDRARATARSVPVDRSVALWAAVVLLASLVPLTDGGQGVSPVLGVPPDALAHTVGYAVLAALAGRAADARSRRLLVAIALATTAYGGGVELLQAAVPGRTPSVADGAVNAIGALAGVAAWRVLASTRRSGRTDAS